VEKGGLVEKGKWRRGGLVAKPVPAPCMVFWDLEYRGAKRIKEGQSTGRHCPERCKYNKSLDLHLM
jgi:hypothetical protein